MRLSEHKVKVLGPSIGGNDPVIDGDGDMICGEENGEGYPCPPDAIVPKPVRIVERATPSTVWGKGAKDRLERRQLVLKRKERRARWWPPKDDPPDISDLSEAIREGRVSEMAEIIGDMFNFEGLGRKAARSEVVDVFTAGGDPAPEIIDEPDNLLYDRPAIVINGEIWERGRDGNKMGHFERVLFPEEGIVEHAMLSLLPDYKGDGTGGDFLLETEEMYRRAGFKKVKLLAGLDDGPYVWAAKGFDWFDEKQRTRFLDVLELEAELDQERLDFDEEPVYFESAEEIREMLRLLQAARNQEFDDEDRIRPFDFTFSDGVRKILTDPRVKHRSWVGIKNL